MTPEDLTEPTDLDQPVLVAHSGGPEHVSVALARKLVAQGIAIVYSGHRHLISDNTVPCGACGHPVVEHRGGWIHSTADGIPLNSGRGCRSASFSRDDDWDNSLSRSWTARPSRRGGS